MNAIDNKNEKYLEKKHRTSFIRVFYGEWVKFYSQLSNWLILIAIIAFNSLLCYAGVSSDASSYRIAAQDPGYAKSTAQFRQYMYGYPATTVNSIVILGVVLAILIGAKMATAEYTSKTLSSLIALVPNRVKLYFAKALLSGLVILCSATAMVAISVGFSQIKLGKYLEQGQLFGAKSILFYIAVVFALIVCSQFGYGIGVLLKNQALATFLGVFSFLVIPSILSSIQKLRGIVKFFPNDTMTAFIAIIAAKLFSWPKEALNKVITNVDIVKDFNLPYFLSALFIFYAIAITVAAVIIFRKRDI